MQDESEKIVEEYISKTPKSIQELIASGGWKDDLNTIAEKFKFEKSKTNTLKNEVLFVLIGMEPKADFVENIKRELGIDNNMAGWVAEEVNKNIFSQVADEINSMWQTEGTESTGDIERSENTEEKSSGVGESFEQIILNQAKAMRPAMPAGEVPHNLPGAEQSEQEKPRAIHNYIGESDPYREPLVG